MNEVVGWSIFAVGVIVLIPILRLIIQGERKRHKGEESDIGDKGEW